MLRLTPATKISVSPSLSKSAVADGHGISFAGDTRGSRDIGECPVAVVSIQAVVELGPGLAKLGNGRAVGEVHVHAAVVVVVERCHAADHQLDLVKSCPRAIPEMEIQPSFFADLLEPDLRVRCNREARRSTLTVRGLYVERTQMWIEGSQSIILRPGGDST